MCRHKDISRDVRRKFPRSDKIAAVFGQLSRLRSPRRSNWERSPSYEHETNFPGIPGQSCSLFLHFQITAQLCTINRKGFDEAAGFLSLVPYRRLSPLCRRAGCARSYVRVTCIMQTTCLWVRARRHVNVMFKHKSHA